MIGTGPESGNTVFDPLSFGSLSEVIKGDHAGIWPHAKWLREAEIKHGRSAMLAFIGTLVALSPVALPTGNIGGFFYEKAASWDQGLASSLATNPFGMGQLFVAIALVEGQSFPAGFWGGEGSREPGDLGFYPFGKKTNKSELKTLQTQELKNGRLAMIAMAGFFAEHLIHGSVPLLPDSV
jgi:hypothetical protein